MKTFREIANENSLTLKALNNSSGLSKEIKRLKKLMLKQSDKVQLATLDNIKFLQDKLEKLY